MSNLAQRIVSEIMADLNERQGFDLSSLDEEIQQEIITAWETIVDRNVLK